MVGVGLIVWGIRNGKPLTAVVCPDCGGRGRLFQSTPELDECKNCAGLGWFGIDPWQPVAARPGSPEKVAMLTVRYASGVPLWNEQDGPVADDDAALIPRLVL